MILFGKPMRTFPDHARTRSTMIAGAMPPAAHIVTRPRSIEPPLTFSTRGRNRRVQPRGVLQASMVRAPTMVFPLNMSI
jgi:hypothetical protein